MARKTWQKEHKWELSKAQKDFLKDCEDNDFVITGIREYVGKTEYRIEHDGLTLERAVYNEKNVDGHKIFCLLVTDFELTKQYNALKEELKNRG